jgi:hypothetical protein
MWNVVQHITTGVSLVALLGMLIFVGYREYLKHRLKVINTAPRQQRADIINKQLNTFGINAANLTREQQYNLASQELNVRSRKYLLMSISAALTMVVFAVIAIIFAPVNTNDIAIRLDHIQKLLEGYNKNPQELAAFINEQGFVNKYPLGFVLFYADGSKTLHYGPQPNPDVNFEPRDIKVLSISADAIHISGFEISVKGSTIKVANAFIQKDGSLHLMRVNGVNIDANSLGSTRDAAAWIIGLAPA